VAQEYKPGEIVPESGIYTIRHDPIHTAMPHEVTVIKGPAVQNKLVGDNDAMNAQTLPKVKMPNRDGFIVRFPDAM
jgi:hypothetical protein